MYDYTKDDITADEMIKKITDKINKNLS